MESLKEIKKSLENQLKTRGADVALYRDQINDYIFFTAQERKMQADIRKRGIRYSTKSSVGKTYEKDNPCLKMALLYSKQKLAILDNLSLSTNTVTGGQPPDDDNNDL